MKRSILTAIGLFACAAALMATASAGDSDHDDPRIGERVDRICFAGSINGFSVPDDYDKVVLLNKGVNNWYFVELSGACTTSRLRFAQAVGIDTFGGGGCLSRGDRLIFSDTPFKPRPHDLTRCLVGHIYEWDEDAVEEEESEEDSET